MIKKILMFILVMGTLTACGNKVEETPITEDVIAVEEVISDENNAVDQILVEDVVAEENTENKN